MSAMRMKLGYYLLSSTTTTIWGLTITTIGRQGHLHHLRRIGTRALSRDPQSDEITASFFLGKRQRSQQNQVRLFGSPASDDDRSETAVQQYHAESQQQQRPFFRIYYNDVYQVHLPPKHRFPMKKYEQVRKQLQQWIKDLPNEQQELVDCEFVVSPLATVDELETTHSKEYIQRFLTGDQTAQEQRNVGFPWSVEGVNRALSSVGGTVAAACSVCEELEKRQRQQQQPSGTNSAELAAPPCWAAHVAGGTHHAFWDYGEGFSVFSDIAVAANVVLERYPHLIQRILILDLDVHQGNGNAVLFQGRPEVTTVSIHCVGNYFSKKETSDLDIELPIGCNDATYLMTLHHWLKRIEKLSNATTTDGPDETSSSFDLVFFQAGVDVLADDRLGRMEVSELGVRRRNELVYDFARRLNLPLVICMGGGYPRNADDWAPIIDAHTNVYFQAQQYLARLATEASRKEDSTTTN